MVRRDCRDQQAVETRTIKLRKKTAALSAHLVLHPLFFIPPKRKRKKENQLI